MTSFELRMGRPQPKLGIAFSHITKKFSIIEPFSKQAVQKEEEKEVEEEQEMIMTMEDQV